MPKPPREALSRSLNRLGSAQSVVNKYRDTKKFLDLWIASTIFILTLVELISWNLQTDNTATITDVGDGYLVYWYPLMCSVSFLFMAIMFVVKSIRYIVCVYTVVASWLYLVTQFINTISILFSIPLGIYEICAQPVLLTGVVLLILIKIIKWATLK